MSTEFALVCDTCKQYCMPYESRNMKIFLQEHAGFGLAGKCDGEDRHLFILPDDVDEFFEYKSYVPKYIA